MSICVECGYLDLKRRDSGKYRCIRKYEHHYADDPECIFFCSHSYSSDYYIKYRSSSEKKEAVNYSKESRNSSCYITTVLVDVLKLEDNDTILNIMRSFRNEFLRKNDKYKWLLYEYDIVGPKIAESIKNDPNNIKLAQNMLKQFIKPIISNINQKKYEQAIVAYANMTKILELHYGYDEIDIRDYNITELNINLLGHGKVLKK